MLASGNSLHAVYYLNAANGGMGNGIPFPEFQIYLSKFYFL